MKAKRLTQSEEESFGGSPARTLDATSTAHLRGSQNFVWQCWRSRKGIISITIHAIILSSLETTNHHKGKQNCSPLLLLAWFSLCLLSWVTQIPTSGMKNWLPTAWKDCGEPSPGSASTEESSHPKSLPLPRAGYIQWLVNLDKEFATSLTLGTNLNVKRASELPTGLTEPLLDGTTANLSFCHVLLVPFLTHFLILKLFSSTLPVSWSPSQSQFPGESNLQQAYIADYL